MREVTPGVFAEVHAMRDSSALVGDAAGLRAAPATGCRAVQTLLGVFHQGFSIQKCGGV
jgi:hypothetical protein